MSLQFQQPYVAYSKPDDVAVMLNRPAGYFSTTTNPLLTDVQDIILQQDSFIDRATGKQFRMNMVQDELYDFHGVGPRAGTVILRKYPVISIQRVDYYNGTSWINTAQGDPQDRSITSSGKESFYFYPERAKIEFYKLRATRRQGIRISYTWGHTDAPHYIRDLSATMAAYEVYRRWQGLFAIASDIHQWREEMNQKINRLFWQAGVKASGWVA